MMKNSDCIFCKIIEGQIPSTKVYEDEKVLAFKDLHPQAAQHYLFIHKGHTSDINHLMTTEPEQIKDIFSAIQQFSYQQGLEEKGFRVVTNLGPHAGQTVFHTHFHLVSGEPLGHFGR
jgi:histidine triad (HIT) family protein